MRRGGLTTLIVAIYLAVGVIVANSHHYFRGLNDVKDFLSAVLAVILWPLVLLGISLHIK
jgi:Mn2+/Fe2+ NRAMP family transporter